MAKKKANKPVAKKPVVKAETSVAKKAEAVAAKKKAEAEFTVRNLPPSGDPEVAAARAELEYLREVVTDPEELGALVAQAVRYQYENGRPDVATKIRLHFENGAPLTRHELRVDGVHPYEEVVPEIEEPPRVGPGSSVDVWREYALAIATDVIEEELIHDSNRDDLIGMLEANALIERVVEGA